MIKVKTLFILLSLIVVSVFSEVSLSSSINPDHVNVYNVTIGPSSSAGKEIKISLAVEGVSKMQSGYQNNIACYQNNNNNQLDDQDTMNGWGLIVFYDSGGTENPRNYIFGITQTTLTKNGENYSIDTPQEDTRKFFQSSTDASVSNDVLASSFELTTEQVLANHVDDSSTGAICFANKDTAFDSIYLIKPSHSGVNNDPNYIMFEYIAPADEGGSTDSGESSSQGALFTKLSISFPMLAMVLWTQM